MAENDILVRAISPDDGGDGLDVLHLFPDALHVPVSHVPLASLVKAFVRLAGPVGEKEGGVRGESVDTREHGVLHPVSGSQQDHQHQDSPKYAEAGQQAACLVSGDRHPYLYPSVYVKHGSFLFYDYSVLMASIAVTFTALRAGK